MKVANYFRPTAALISVSAAMALLASGCGSGGGSAAVVATNASNGAVSDTKSDPQTGNGSTSPAGCTTATFTPNYANLLPLYRWAAFPVKIYFLNSGLVTKDDGSTEDLKATAMQGFNAWAAATNNGVTIQVTSDASQANITVHFGALPATPTANDVLGLESSTLYSDNTIKSADILLNTWPSMTAANVASFQETATHEFGHALGINGHSDSSQDVMYAAHSIVTQKPLSHRDINTLLTGYCNVFGRDVPPRATGSTKITHND